MKRPLFLYLLNTGLFVIAFVLAMLSPRPLFFWLGLLWAAAAIAYALQAWREWKATDPSDGSDE